MERQLFTQFVAEMLFMHDPMDTGCRDNMIYDWYTDEAHAITSLVFDNNIHVSSAMYDVFTDYYGWDYVVTKTKRINDCYSRISTKLYAIDPRRKEHGISII